MKEGYKMDDKELIESIMNTWEIESKSVNDLCRDMDQNALLKTIKTVAECDKRMLITGCGTSAMAARKIAHSLCCIERPSIYLNPSDAVHGGLGVVQTGDIVIMISKSGNTKELLNLIPTCKKKEVKLIAVTENECSTIAANADIVLKIKVEKEPCPFNMLATASTAAVIAVFDAVCIALMQYMKYTQEQFALIHPGGAVGDRLFTETRGDKI